MTLSNKQFRRHAWLSLLACTLMLTSSCATILAGKKNTIHVAQGSPAAAQVYLDGVYLGDAPLNMRIDKHRIQQGSIIEFRREGYETQRYSVVRKVHGLYTAADILTGVIPLIIDTATGNIYRPNTRHLSYELQPLNANNNGKEQQP